MRDILLALVLGLLLPVGLMHPWIGVMLWSWVSLMSPHRMTYGFMYDAPVAMLTGAVTLLGLVVSKDPKKLPMAPPLVWLGLFGLWMVICFPFSLLPGEYNWGQLDKVLKIQLMTFVAAAVLSTRRQVDWMIGVCAFSIAYFGVKGGIFTILTGGGLHVRGEGGFIAGNNEVGLALIMIVPLMYYFLTITQNKWVKRLLMLSMLLCVVGILGTQSRGALLGTAAMTAAFIARAQSRARLIVPIIVISGFVIAFMPDSWWARMGTIDNYDEDQSAMGRINAWILALNIAKSHFFGGGFYLEEPHIFAIYAPAGAFVAVAHSIYFQVLGQHGFIGLLLFIGFWISTWRTCRWIARNSDSAADQALARMVEISLVGFAAGGAFLNMAYFDGPYYMMAAMVVLRYKLLNNVARLAPPRWGLPSKPLQPMDRRA